MTHFLPRVFITGVSGLLGSHIAVEFRKLGYEVVGVKQKNTPTPNVIKDIQVFEGDILDFYWLYDILQQGDLVIHCAALVSFDRKDREYLYQLNVEGTKNVLQASIENRVLKFIHISSVAALGRPIDGQLISESSLWEESDFNTHYAISKFQSELEVWRAFEEGLSGFILNPSVILGRGNLHNTSNRLFSNLFRKTIFMVDGGINVVDVHDVVKALKICLEKELNSERFLINGHKVSIGELMSAISKRSKFTSKVIEIPLWLAMCVRPIENFVAFMIGKKPQINRETLKVLKSESSYNNQKSKIVLGLKYRKLEETMDECCHYYVENYSV